MEKNQKIAKYIQDFGRGSSIGLLDPFCKIFQTQGIEGAIGYREKFGCIVIFGDPVCRKEDTPMLVQAFQEHFHNKSIVYVLVSNEFKNLAGKAYISVGNEIILNPQAEILHGHEARHLRNKLNHATENGISVHEYQDENVKEEMQEVAQKWLKERRGLQIYYTHVDLFSNPYGKRWFYAKRNGKIVGLLVINRIHQGWVINQSMTTEDAGIGTSELLIIELLRVLKREGCSYVVASVVPTLFLNEMEGFSPLSTWVAKGFYKIAKYLFKLHKREEYWGKFKPQKAPSYFLFSSPKITPCKILAIMHAFNATVAAK